MGNRLDKVITIQKLTGHITNSNGFEEEVWTDYRKMFASVNNLYGKEFWSAKAVNSENTVEFTVRFVNGLLKINSKEYRVVYGTKIYDIVFIDNIKHQNSWVKIKGVEVS